MLLKYRFSLRMASAHRITLRQAGHKEVRKAHAVGWLTHYDWMLQLHDEAAGRDPYLVDNKFQGDEAQKNVTVNTNRRTEGLYM